MRKQASSGVPMPSTSEQWVSTGGRQRQHLKRIIGSQADNQERDRRFPGATSNPGRLTATVA